MVTSFINRWSKRKLEESTDKESTLQSPAQTPESDNSEDCVIESVAANSTTPSEHNSPEEMSIANLLVSEAEQSVKKAALRKLFLSEEFNVRDGLDDYDEDYSNLKSLSQTAAETLRNWVKEQTEDQEQNETVIASSAETERAEAAETIDEDQSPQSSPQSDETSIDVEGASITENHYQRPTGDETKYTTQ